MIGETFVNTRKSDKTTFKKKFVYKNFNKAKTSTTINTKLGSSNCILLKLVTMQSIHSMKIKIHLIT
ncbi:hypothetical protein ALNOE001_19620 [Candidatus Methanobinarius endosymbioticus]|uniref:Uncharacterized protein n=1 Tax=Candidatus Methanobinarius endosymbioticus TaxID=2006182 RepID=A0A366M7L9_9EURY|nr:hypothetical protein ALNOE001_19620 [Candidatus Methanobinarius endosymbioticus]